MKSTKMEKFQEKGMKNLSALNLNESEMSGVKGGEGDPLEEYTAAVSVSATVVWKNFFNGSLFTGGGIDEFD